METVVVLNFEGYSISFKNIIKLIEFFPYGSGRRLAIELMAMTGMRPSELDGINPECFWVDSNSSKTHLIWKPGKNQKGFRNEVLPEWLINEIGYYLDHSFRLQNRPLFSFTHDNLRDYINHHVRPVLRGDFIKKRPGGPKGSARGSEYIVQLKSFRHTYACKEFYEAMEQYGKDLAIHMVGAKMRHKTTYMTARHYVSDITNLKQDLERFKGVSIASILRTAMQRKLLEFF